MPSDESASEPRTLRFQDVANYLRAEITSGSIAPGEKAPSQHKLMEQFGASRNTVQRAIAELAHEGWLDAVQGSGTFVKGPPRADGQGGRTPTSAVLKEWLERAFQGKRVELDVFSFTTESFYLALADALMPIRVERHGPDAIHVRMLLPENGPTLAYPRRVDGQPDERLPLRTARLIERQAGNVDEALMNLQDWLYVPEVIVETRHVPVMPLQKMYLLNRCESLRGNYEIGRRTLRLDEGELLDVYDVLGLSTELDLFTSGPDADDAGSRVVRQDQKLFDSLWSSVAGAADEETENDGPTATDGSDTP